MDSVKTSFSARLYEILSKNTAEINDNDNSELTDAEIEEELPLECCYCSELFFETEKFEQHKCKKSSPSDSQDDSVKRYHLCTFEACNKSFKKSSDLRKHQRIHLNIRKFKCVECSKDFVHQTSLKNHLLTHSKVKSFVCSDCGLAFSTNGNLTQHRLKHDGDKKFSCDICDKKFIRSSNLKEHLATHTKEQRHECSSCDKKFFSSSALSKHRKLHTAVRPFQCPIPSCLKSFDQHSHLQKHLSSNVHSSTNKCNICSKTFRRIETFQAHMKIHEDQNKPIIISDEIIVPKNS